MPLTASSASASSMQASNSASPSKDITFIDLPGTSQVMVATPSASLVRVNSAIFPVSRSVAYTRSMMVAAPMPDAMQRVARPTCLS